MDDPTNQAAMPATDTGKPVDPQTPTSTPPPTMPTPPATDSGVSDTPTAPTPASPAGEPTDVSDIKLPGEATPESTDNQPTA